MSPSLASALHTSSSSTLTFSGCGGGGGHPWLSFSECFTYTVTSTSLPVVEVPRLCLSPGFIHCSLLGGQRWRADASEAESCPKAQTLGCAVSARPPSTLPPSTALSESCMFALHVIHGAGLLRWRLPGRLGPVPVSFLFLPQNKSGLLHWGCCQTRG